MRQGVISDIIWKPYMSIGIGHWDNCFINPEIKLGLWRDKFINGYLGQPYS